MATQTAKLYFDRGAMITEDYPHSTFPVPAVLREEDGAVLEKIASIPDTLYGKELVSTVVYVYSEAYFFKPASVPPSSVYGFYKAGDIGVIEEPWDEAEVTYSAQPKDGFQYDLSVPSESPGISGVRTAQNAMTSAIFYRMVLDSGARSRCIRMPRAAAAAHTSSSPIRTPSSI